MDFSLPYNVMSSFFLTACVGAVTRRGNDPHMRNGSDCHYFLGTVETGCINDGGGAIGVYWYPSSLMLKVSIRLNPEPQR